MRRWFGFNPEPHVMVTAPPAYGKTADVRRAGMSDHALTTATETRWGRQSPVGEMAHLTLIKIECLMTLLAPTDVELGALVRLVVDEWHAYCGDGLHGTPSTQCARGLRCDREATWMVSIVVPDVDDPYVSVRMCGRHAGDMVTARLPGVTFAPIESAREAM